MTSTSSPPTLRPRCSSASSTESFMCLPMMPAGPDSEVMNPILTGSAARTAWPANRPTMSKRTRTILSWRTVTSLVRLMPGHCVVRMLAAGRRRDSSTPSRRRSCRCPRSNERGWAGGGAPCGAPHRRSRGPSEDDSRLRLAQDTRSEERRIVLQVHLTVEAGLIVRAPGAVAHEHVGIFADLARADGAAAEILCGDDVVGRDPVLDPVDQGVEQHVRVDLRPRAAATMGVIRIREEAVELLKSRHTSRRGRRLGARPLHLLGGAIVVVVAAAREDQLVEQPVIHDHLAAATAKRVEVRLVGADGVVEEGLGGRKVVDERGLRHRVPVEGRILLDPVSEVVDGDRERVRYWIKQDPTFDWR